MPTRGQAFFIFYLIAINIILCAAGYQYIRPNAWRSSPSGIDGAIADWLTDRCGVLCLANIPLIFLYAGRNNVLLWLTNWSHGTFLLLHRWVAGIATLQAILHSLIYLRMYVHDGYYGTEHTAAYWIWGVTATLCLSVLLPSSILPIREKFYELFLAWHVLLSIFVVVGCYWHIVANYSTQWGYQNWIIIAIAIWGFERAMRLARLARNGIKTAQVTVIDEDYVRVNIEGVSGSGHAYLYFPTLTWRVWENHPFTVASAVFPPTDPPSNNTLSHSHSIDIEKLASTSPSDSTNSSPPHSGNPQPLATVGLTFFLRTKAGLTSLLRSHPHLPVLVESAYGPHEDLSQYSLLLCIAGGVGITACLPYLRAHAGSTKLFWGARSQGIVDAMAPSLNGVVELATFVGKGKRMDIGKVLREELMGDCCGSSSSPTVVVLVSGPSSMADEVRCGVCEIARRKKGLRVKLVEEAFSW